MQANHRRRRRSSPGRRTCAAASPSPDGRRGPPGAVSITVAHPPETRRAMSMTDNSGSVATAQGERPISVLIADDQRLVRAGFRVILDSEPDIRVVGEAANGAEAVSLARTLAPDVVLMDIRMPQLDGLSAARQLLASGDSRILILTTFDADEYVYETLRMGASGFLL